MPAMTGGITMVVAGIGTLALSSAFFAGRGIVMGVLLRVLQKCVRIYKPGLWVRAWQLVNRT